MKRLCSSTASQPPLTRSSAKTKAKGQSILPRPSGPNQSTRSESVSVYIESQPHGAVIKLKNRVFGRSPLKLRFRPGIMYELTFVKKGYQYTSKRFTVTGRKNQKVRVTLKKKPTPKKSLLQRIFGRKRKK